MAHSGRSAASGVESGESPSQPLKMSFRASSPRKNPITSGPNNPRDYGMPLDPRYKSVPKSFFEVGRVFKALWTEPASESCPPRFGIIDTIHGQKAYSKTQYFVVVRSGSKYCVAVPVNTYGGQGASKYGLTKSEHAIIYTSKQPPKPLPEEAGIMTAAIRVKAADGALKLDPMSRIDLGKLHTIEHYLRVMDFGIVQQRCIPTLLYQVNSLWKEMQVEGETGSATW